MKQILAFLCLVLLLIGCTPKKEKEGAVGPLSQIQRYQVIPVLSVDNAPDREDLFDHLIRALEELGTVHISTDCITHAPPLSAGMVIAVSELERSKTGFIKIFADGEALINKYKTSCELWTTLYSDPTLPYLVEGSDGISFVRDPTAESPDVKVVATQMLARFAEQYRRDNPDVKSIFHIYDLFAPTQKKET